MWQIISKIFDYGLLPRETIELGELNKIHEDFNNKKLTPKYTRYELYKRKWKYHHDRVDMLITFTYLMENKK